MLNKLKSIFKTVSALTSPTIRYLANMIGPGGLANVFAETGQNIAERKEEIQQNSSLPEKLQEESPASMLEDLRKNLESYIDEVTKIDENDKDKKRKWKIGHQSEKDNASHRRIYIMIDDLDRLEPERAVEIMEALKTFLNVPNCIFILAIDFNVVLRGVRKKYGDDFTEDKGRAFFDKIIQVPFNLPVGAYSLNNYVKRFVSNLSDADQDFYMRILQTTVGNNPRSIKRIFNTFNLTRSISDSESLQDANKNESDIFAMLCFQKRYPRVFEDLAIETRGDQKATDYLTTLENDLADDSDTWQDLSRNDRISLTRMLVEFGEHFGYNDSGGKHDSESDDDQAEERLRQALMNVAVTSIRSASNDEQEEDPTRNAEDLRELRVDANGITMINSDGKYKKSLLAGAKLVGATLDGIPIDSANWSALSNAIIKTYASVIERNDKIGDGTSGDITHKHFRYFRDEHKAESYRRNITKGDGSPLKQSNIKATEVMVDGVKGYVVANHMGNAVNLEGVKNLIAAYAEMNEIASSPVLVVKFQR